MLHRLPLRTPRRADLKRTHERERESEGNGEQQYE
jgi:hypothetical protein